MTKRKIKSALEGLWAGSEESLLDYLKLEEQSVNIKARDDHGDEDEYPYLLERHGSIGVINIHGSLSNNRVWYNKFLGVPEYSAIQEALVAAAEDNGIQTILLNISSGGGPVNGLADTAELVTQVNDKVKPVIAYTDGNMLSAAYWLGCSAGQVFCSNVSSVGSIGVIANHVEYSKKLEEEGVKVTVLRAGKFKALATSYEALTEEARNQIQIELDAAYKVFVQYVATSRSKSYQYADAVMGEGRKFFGELALEAGMVDGITSLGKLMSQIEDKSLDTRQQFVQTSRNTTQGVNEMARKTLTDAQAAAIQAGASLADVANLQATEEVETPETDTDVEAPEADAPVASAKDEPTKVTQVKNETGNEVVALLQDQLREKDKNILDLNVTLSDLNKSIEASAGASKGLLTIAAKSLNNMRVALGMSVVDTKDMTESDILSAHDVATTEFQSKFVVGGVAAVATAVDAQDTAHVTNGMWQARLNAAGKKQK
jgi:signal peptide peptidase SppA